MFRKKRVTILAGFLLLLAALGIVFLALKRIPSLLETFPIAGAVNVPPTTSLRLSFSTPMQAQSVTDRLTTDPPRPGMLTWEGNTIVFTPSQPWPGGQVITVNLAAGARSEAGLAFAMGAQSFSFTTSQTLLAYLWPSKGPADLYALDPLTGDIQRLTTDANVLDFDISADGLLIYYSASNLSSGSDLFRLDRTQSSFLPERLVSCGKAACRSPAISPNGQMLAYEYLSPSTASESQPTRVRLVDLSTEAATSVGVSSHETMMPVWSSTNRLAYYDQTSQAYILYDPQTQASLNLPNQTGQGGSWSPDGRYFVAAEVSYTSLNTQVEVGVSRLIRYDTTTGAALDLTRADDLEDFGPVFSPDGSQIAFGRKYLDPSRWKLSRPLWIMAAEGSAARQIMTDLMLVDYNFAWSLDGQRLAFMRFDQGAPTNPPVLWLVNVDGTNPLQLVIGGYAPHWIP
jgi:Tol biopolymer transport system component